MDSLKKWLESRGCSVRAVGPAHLIVALRPQGALPCPVSTLELVVGVPVTYPAEAATMTVRTETPSGLPPRMASALSLILQRIHGHAQPRGNVQSAVRWLENHLDEVLQGLLSLQDEAAAAATGTQPLQEDRPLAPLALASPPAVVAPAVIDAPRSDAAAERSLGQTLAEPPVVSEAILHDTARARPSDVLQQAAAAAPAALPPALFAEDWWPVDAHRRWEDAVRCSLLSDGMSAAEARTWVVIAQAVGADVTPESCLARYLQLRVGARRWYRRRFGRNPSSGEVCSDTPLTAAAVDVPRGNDHRVAHGSQRDVNNSQRVAATGAGVTMPSMARAESSAAAVVMATAADAGGTAVAVSGGRGLVDSESEHEDEAEGPGDDDYVDDEEDVDAPPVAVGSGGTRTGGDGAAAAEGDTAMAGAETEEELLTAAAFSRVSLSPAHRGTQLRMSGMSLRGVGVAAASRVVLNIQCTRCGSVAAAPVTLHGARVPAAGDVRDGATSDAATADDDVPADRHQQWCAKCSLLLTVALRPALLHATAGGDVIGYIDSTNARVAGLQDSSLLATCLDCGAVATFDSVVPPCMLEATCRSCYLRLRVAAKAFSVETVATASAMSALPSPPRRAAPQRIAAGKPLPDNGACKHYKHSYRWLRFPCCGIAYACDTCHDERSDHPHEWATRMICGMCAREQPWSNEVCVSCGARMGRAAGAGSSARFWEGGGGQRNRALLSRKDPHKHKGSSAKTTSNKASRVGPHKDRPEPH